MLERLARRLLMTSSYLDPKLKAAGEKFSFRGLAGFEEDSSNKKKKKKKKSIKGERSSQGQKSIAQLFLGYIH
jgi:hypothetical protein